MAMKSRWHGLAPLGLTLAAACCCLNVSAQGSLFFQGDRMSRAAPKPVAPIVIGDLQYGNANGYNQNILPVFDVPTGAKVGEFEIYKYPVDPAEESDVQLRYFTKMELQNQGQDIFIENENKHQFTFNFATKAVREINHPCRLELVRTERSNGRWTVLLALSFVNYSRSKTYYLDTVSFGATPSLYNNIFSVAAGKQAIPYRGVMAKRDSSEAAQDMHRVAPGETYRTVIDIGAAYHLPEEGGQFTVKFASYNHFSPDQLELFSNEISVNLK